MVILHRNRFVPYAPFLTAGIALSQPSGLLAVARKSAPVVDIFSIPANFTHFKRLVVLPYRLPIEAICFVPSTTCGVATEISGINTGYNPRRDKVIGKCSKQYEMVAVGAADGVVRVFSPRTGRLMCQASSFGGAIWAMCPLDNLTIAVGCRDGTVRALRMSEDALAIEYVGIVDKTPTSGGVAVLASTAGMLAIGLDNGLVRIVRVLAGCNFSGRFVHQYSQPSAIPTALSWSPSADTLFIGFNSGALIALDPKTGVPASQTSSHCAPILSILATSHQDVFAAGSDFRTLHLSRSSPQDRHWLRSSQRRLCSNDVVGMAYTDLCAGNPMLVQACIDGSLRIANPLNFSNNKHDRCLSGLPVRPIIRTNSRFMAANMGTDILIWRHGNFDDNTKTIVQGPELLASLKFSKQLVIDFDISPAGDRIAAGFSDCLKMFGLTDSGVEAIYTINKCYLDAVKFSSSGQLYIYEQVHNGFRVRKETNAQLELLHHVETSAFAVRMALCDKFVAVSTSDNSTHLIPTENGEHTRRLELPGVAAAMAINNSTLVCYLASHECFVFDLESDSLVRREIKVPKDWSQQHDAIQGALIYGSQIVVWSEFGYCKLPLTGAPSKRRHDENSNGGDKKDPLRSLIHFDFIGKDDAVIVERPWEDVMPLLPPATKVPKYGQN